MIVTRLLFYILTMPWSGSQMRIIYNLRYKFQIDWLMTFSPLPLFGSEG